MPLSNDVQQLVDSWLSYDDNPETRAEIEQLVRDEAQDELEKRLSSRIAFGTAGLRGRMQAGFAFMNTLTVTQATQGLCRYIEEQFGAEEAQRRGVVFGYDGRYRSLDFARRAASTFASRGFRVYLFSELAATPLVSFAVTQNNCVAGVMVTASHNPKDDNGYKVYWENGAQIVSPHDKGIARHIEDNLTLWGVDYSLCDSSPLVTDPTAAVSRDYFAAIRERYCYHHATNRDTELRVVFTPMHGVGKEWVRLAFEAFNLHPYIPVAEQIEPDPEFTTVTFPNPEEGAGALKLAIETAERNNSPLIIANDPDSDRLAVAERRADTGEWHIFSGNETGILIGDWCWRRHLERHPDTDAAKCVVLNTTVSSKMLSALARDQGLHYEETLTGFKWLGNRADALRRDGYTFIMAFEQAIGFMIGDVCLDKDGVRAAAVLAEYANELYRNGSTFAAHLESLYERLGYYATNDGYYFNYEPAKMQVIFDRIRTGGPDGGYKMRAGEFEIEHVRDLTTGFDTQQPDQRAILPVSSSSQMITFYFKNGCTCTLRGSGTEPKLKYYVELNGDYANRAEVDARLQRLVDAVVADFLEPKRNELVAPNSG